MHDVKERGILGGYHNARMKKKRQDVRNRNMDAHRRDAGDDDFESQRPMAGRRFKVRDLDR